MCFTLKSQTRSLMKALIVVMASCAALHAWAGLHWYESFDYSAGDLTNVAAAWQGFSGGAGLDVGDGNLAYPAYPTLGRQLACGAGSLDARRSVPTTTVVYASLLLRCDKIPAGNAYLLSFYNTSIGYIARFFAGNGTDQSKVKYGVSSSGGATTWSTREFATGTVVKLTIKYDAASQSAALWCNNDFLYEGPADAAYTAGNLTNLVTFFAIRQGDALDNGDAAFMLDELRVGSTWADVQLAGIPRLAITEIMSNSRNTTSNGDWFEIYNADVTNVSLAGFSFDDAHAVIGANPLAATTLAPGEAMVVYDTGTVRAVSAFRAAWGLAPAAQVDGLTFGNGLGNGDSIYLWDAASNQVAYQTYPAYSTGYSREWGRGGADLGYSVYGENGAWSNAYGDIGSPTVTVADPAGTAPTNVVALLAPVTPPTLLAAPNALIPAALRSDLSNGTLAIGYGTVTNVASWANWTPAVITNGSAPFIATANVTIASPGLYYLAARWTDGLYTYYGVTPAGQTNASAADAVCTVIITNTTVYTFPTPYVVGLGPYAWSNWPAASAPGTYPPNMVFHKTSIADPDKAAEMYNNYTSAYNLTSASRMNGLDQDGVSWLNTSGIGQGYLGAAVLGLNTVGALSNTAVWTCGVVAQGDGATARVYNVALQYALAPFSTFIDVPGVSDYTSAGKATNSAETFSVTLPAACDNQSQVYLRWKYYSLPVSGASGSRPRLRLDDVSVSGVPEPALLGLAGLLLLAQRRK